MGLSLERTTSGNERDTAGQVTVLVRAPYLAEEFTSPPSLPAPIPGPGRDFWSFHRQHPQPQHPGGLWARGRGLPALVRGPGHHPP